MATPTLLTGIAYAVKINGKNLYELGVQAYNIPQMNTGPMDLQQITFPERLDAYSFRSTFLPQPFVITGRMKADSVADLRTNLDLLNAATRPTRGDRASIPTKIRVELKDQTDRYWPCAYAGNFNASPIDNRGPTGTAFVQFTLPLLQLTPYALAVEPTSVVPAAAAAVDFTVLDLGTAPCPWFVELEGAATAPNFTLTNCSFYWDADYTMAALGVTGNTLTGTSGQTPDSDAFEPGDYGQGRYVQLDTFSTFWSAGNSIISNPDEGTVVVVVRPQFAYNASANEEYFLDWYVDADNGVRLIYDGSDDKFYFSRERATASAAAGGGGDAQTFASDDAMVLVGTWGADGIKVYKDGELLDTNAGTTGVVGATGALYLNDFAGTKRGDIDYEYVMMLPYQLSDEQVTYLSAVPEDFTPTAITKSKTGNLAANERSILNFEDMTAVKIATDLTTTNDLDDWDTSGFPALTPPAQCIYVPATETIAGVKVRYRKRWM